MSFFKSSALLGALAASVSLVDAHGYVTGIVADGQYYGGYLVGKYSYTDSPPDTVGWSSTATDLGFVSPDAYTDPDIICHKGSKPAALTAPVSAGGTIEFQWTDWPESHHGPVLNYLASCGGDCSSVDKTQLEFFKINQGGLVDGSNPPGQWASDQLISNNQSWSITIPESIAPGNYVLRHEIIGLHSAGQANGAQNYPQCFNIKVTGSGSDKPAGTLGTALYTPTDPGIKINIYQPLTSYEIPGPALISAGTTGNNGDGSGSDSGSGSGSSSSQTPAVPTATPPPAGTTAGSLPPYPTPTGGSPTGPIGTGTGVPAGTPTPPPSDPQPTSSSTVVVSVTPIPQPSDGPSFSLPVAVPSQPEGGQDQDPTPTAGSSGSSPSSSSPDPTSSAGSSSGTCKEDPIPDSPVKIPDNMSESDLIALMNKVLDRLFTENQHPRQFNRPHSSY